MTTEAAAPASAPAKEKLGAIVLEKLRPKAFEASPSSQVWNSSLEIDARENVLFVAPSGSGKTSLCSYLLGLRGDYEGAIDYRFCPDETGPREKALPPSGRTAEFYARLRSLHIAYLPQDFRLMEELSPFENARLRLLAQAQFRTGRRGDKKEIARWATELEDLAGRLDILRVLHKPCRLLSRGERQRAATLRTLALPFDLFIADEGFSHLDESRSREAFWTIKNKAEENGAGVWLFELSRPRDFDFEAARIFDL